MAQRSTFIVHCSLFFVLCAACQAPRNEPGVGATQTKGVEEQDQEYSCRKFIWAERYTLTTRLVPRSARTFARLKGPQQRILSDLLRRSELVHDVKLADGRMVVTLPPSLCPPKTSPWELVIAEDLQQLVVFAPQRKLRHELDLERLPDVLDGHVARSRRDQFSLRLGALSAPARVAPDALKTTTLPARLGLRYYPRLRRHRGQPVTQQLQLELRQEPRVLPGHQPLLLIAAPLFVSARGLQALEPLALRMGRTPPQSWTVTTVNEARQVKLPPRVLTSVVFHGHVRLPRCSLSTVRKGYTDARATPRSTLPGLQLQPKAALARIRQGKSSGSLKVNNRSPATAYVYADGVLLGWLAPGRRISFEGLPDGFYRLYARSPSGLYAWGPEDLYLPGPWTLR